MRVTEYGVNPVRSMTIAFSIYNAFDTNVDQVTHQQNRNAKELDFDLKMPWEKQLGVHGISLSKKNPLPARPFVGLLKMLHTDRFV